jgi:Protein of unknown function (DUF732)
VLACSLLVVASCGATHPSAARQAAERGFVSDVQETATDIGRYKTPDQVIKLGDAVCDGFRANASIQQIAGVLEQSGARDLPPEDLGAVMSVAVKDLCPVYNGRLSPVQGG